MKCSQTKCNNSYLSCRILLLNNQELPHFLISIHDFTITFIWNKTVALCIVIAVESKCIYVFVWTLVNVQVVFADKCIFNWRQVKNESLISQFFLCFSVIIIIRCLKLTIHNQRGKFDHSKLLYSLCLGFYSADSRRSLLVYQTPWQQQRKKKKLLHVTSTVSSFPSFAPINTHFRSLPAWSINPVECVPATPQLRLSVIFGPRRISVHRQETCKGRPTWQECI